MESIKLQLGSLTILVFITIVYVFRLIHYKRKVNFNFFLIFIVLSFIEIVFDGLTAYSVNNLDKFDHTFNLILHGIFLSCNIFCLSSSFNNDRNVSNKNNKQIISSCSFYS